MLILEFNIVVVIPHSQKHFALLLAHQKSGCFGFDGLFNFVLNKSL